MRINNYWIEEPSVETGGFLLASPLRKNGGWNADDAD